MQTCLELSEFQRVRLFCIVSQSRCDRSMEAALARCLGYDPDATEAERKAVFREAGDLRRAVEKGVDHKALDAADPRARSLEGFVPLIPISAMARRVWDAKRDEVEKAMRQAARSLPAFAWVAANARGVGDLGLARLVGEAPLIGSLATKERLWKRLGLAVIAGERQQRKGTAEEALLHGYRPSRRAESWSVLSDTMFRQQWRGGEGDAPGFPIGPYGEVYRARKAHTMPRIAATAHLDIKDRQRWTLNRCEKDARRIMSKALLEDLWRVFRGMPALYPARWEAIQAQRNAA